MYGYFSEKAKKLCGSVFWVGKNGKPLLVTSVGAELNPKGSGYKWDDAVNVGEVVRFHSGGLKVGLTFPSK